MPEGRREADRISVPNMTESQKIFSSIIENQITINTAVNDLQEIQAKHHKVLLEGNGELPMLERLRNVEAFIGNWKYWGRFIGGAMIVQTIAFAFAIAIALIRFLPLLEKLANTP